MISLPVFIVQWLIVSRVLPTESDVVPDVVMTGGVAQNQGVVDALEAELGVKICTSPLTQYNGALAQP